MYIYTFLDFEGNFICGVSANNHEEAITLSENDYIDKDTDYTRSLIIKDKQVVAITGFIQDIMKEQANFICREANYDCLSDIKQCSDKLKTIFANNSDDPLFNEGYECGYNEALAVVLNFINNKQHE